MASQFKVDIEVDIKVPDFLDADIPSSQIARKVSDAAHRNIRDQISPSGVPFQKLKESTLKRKRRLKQPLIALIAKGVMKNAIHIYHIAQNQWAVGVIQRGVPRRDLVALIHQEQGVPSKTGRVARPFIGMSDQILKWANARMQRWVTERIAKAAHKKFNMKF